MAAIAGTTLNFAALVADVKAAREDARREARRDFRCVQSRGTWLCTGGAHGQIGPRAEAECPDWDGTKGDIEALIALAQRDFPAVETIYIAGGFDGADQPSALPSMGGDDYAPWASAWSVTVWARPAGAK